MDASVFGSVQFAGLTQAPEKEQTIAEEIIERGGFQKYMEEEYLKRIEAKARQIVLAKLGMDEEDLARMPASELEVIERLIQEKIKQKIEQMIAEDIAKAQGRGDDEIEAQFQSYS